MRLWRTRDGQELYPFEMTEEHLRNAKSFLERKISSKAYLTDHACPGYDSSDVGPCADCDNETDKLIVWEEWLVTFDREIRRRAADARQKEVEGT